MDDNTLDEVIDVIEFLLALATKQKPVKHFTGEQINKLLYDLKEEAKL